MPRADRNDPRQRLARSAVRASLEHMATVQIALTVVTGERVVIVAPTQRQAREQYEAAVAVLKRWGGTAPTFRTSEHVDG